VALDGLALDTVDLEASSLDGFDCPPRIAFALERELVDLLAAELGEARVETAGRRADPAKRFLCE